MAEEMGLIKLQKRGSMYLPWPFRRWVYDPTASVCYMMAFGKPDYKKPAQ